MLKFSWTEAEDRAIEDWSKHAENSPTKDAHGDMIFPSRVWLSCTGCSPHHLSLDATLFVEGDQFFKGLEVGDVPRFVDVRGK